MKQNISACYTRLGRYEEALNLDRECYDKSRTMVGATAVNICVAALNLASSLIEEPSTRNIDEALPLLRDGIAEAQRAFGRDNIYTFKFQRMYAKCLYEKENASLGDINKAVATLEDVERRERRVLGSEHPQTRGTRILLEGARDLARRHSDA